MIFLVLVLGTAKMHFSCLSPLQINTSFLLVKCGKCTPPFPLPCAVIAVYLMSFNAVNPTVQHYNYCLRLL